MSRRSTKTGRELKAARGQKGPDWVRKIAGKVPLMSVGSRQDHE